MDGKRKKIYIAGKYRGKTYSETDDNIKRATEAHIKLLSIGWNAFCPHTIFAHYEIYEPLLPFGKERWLELDLEWLEICDAVFMLKKWMDSPGAINEHRFALMKGLPVFHEEDGYISPEEVDWDNPKKYNSRV
jgi:hypothetical protein